MGIDLTRLNNLRTGAEQAPEKPTETQTARGEHKTLTKPQTAPETLIEGLEGIHKLQRQADAKKQDIDRSLSIYKEYQHNIIISSQLQTEILKGVKAGEDIYSLFLKACKAISLMTSNSVFYNQLERDVKTIYGQGILNPLAISEHEHQEQE